MSRHQFKAESKFGSVQVWMGYDRPLDGFYFTVFDSDGAECFYSNLDEQNPHPKSLNPWLAKAKEFGIAFPDGLLAEVQADFDNQVGNKFKIWNQE
jgi:hypothetical protein